MDQVNAIITVFPRRLAWSSQTMEAAVGSEFVVRLVEVPADVGGVYVRICPDAGDGGFHDFPASAADSGEWLCRIAGASFRRPGAGWYEIWATAAGGMPTALARGKVVVARYSAGVAIPLDSRRRTVMVLPDRDGAMHAIYAVRDEAGEWTFEVGDVDDPATIEARTVTVGAVSAGDAAVTVSEQDGAISIQD